MLHAVLGILAGALVWMFIFYTLAFGLAALWPEYGVHGSRWMKESLFTFTSLMACFNLLFWLLAEVGAGFVTMKIAKRLEAVGALAAMLGIYLALVHLVLYWPRFPWWYNLGVFIPSVFAVLLGGKLAAGAERRA